MTTVWIIFFILLSYFLGSIPSGLLIGKVFKGVDIRQFGSKNMGATNAIRVLGFRYGIFAFVFDALKGALVILVLYFINDPSLYILPLGNGIINITILYGAIAVLGHVFPIYIHFKGGKAVATSAGMVLAIEPIIFVITIITFLSMFRKTRYVSMSSTIAASAVIFMFFLRIFIRVFLLGQSDHFITYILELIVVICLAILIFIRHRANYKRLREGTENKM